MESNIWHRGFKWLGWNTQSGMASGGTVFSQLISYLFNSADVALKKKKRKKTKLVLIFLEESV